MSDKSFKSKFEIVKEKSEEELKNIEAELKEKGEVEKEKLKEDMEDFREGLEEYAKANTDKSFPHFNGC
ncbi:MAG: hypothetical protein ACRCWM_00030 [Sarcina sp.]